MRLFIAEKPSLARAIADALPGPKQKADGHIKAGDDIVSWCIGHLLEQAEPDAYSPAFKQWSHDHLPIIPDQWQWVPKSKTRGQLGVLRKLVKSADRIVHAGDPDREGQLLVDEVIDYLKVPKTKKATMQRCLIADLNPSAVKRSLANLKPNADYKALSTSALARARADWLYGMNLTRAFTLQGQTVGYRGVLSVGRVQTPVLGLVVRRDEAIDAFVSQPYFDVWANLETGKGEHFKAKWEPSEACEPWLDEQRRNLSLPLAKNVVQRISNQPARVEDCTRQTKRQAPPLPHSLSSLQMEANRVFGLGAQQVLDLCQSLYETHKAITYPRSDSRHLPQEHFAEAPKILSAVKNSVRQLGETGAEAAWPTLDESRKSKAWNDAKVGAHHAIIPTERVVQRLSPQEKQVYWLVSRAYLAQFMPPWIRLETDATITIAGGTFKAKDSQTQDPGWKVLYPSRTKKEEEPTPPLPPLENGQPLRSHQGEIVEKHTSPPKPFTEATLLAAMTGIARFVRDPALKAVLKDTDGLGTEATRAGIIELLFKRGFLKREAKNIRSTEAGRAIIHALPDALTEPDRTARWESLLADIAGQKARYDDLMQPLVAELGELTGTFRRLVPSGLKGLPAPGKTGGRRKGRKGGYAKRKRTAATSS